MLTRSGDEAEDHRVIVAAARERDAALIVVGLPLTLQGKLGRQGIYFSAAFVRTDGRVLGIRLGSRVVPTLTAAYEVGVTRHTNAVLQLYASKKGLALLKAAPRPLIGVLQQALSELPAARLVALHAELAHVTALMKGKQAAAARALPLSEM